MKKILIFILTIFITLSCKEEELINISDPSNEVFEDAIETVNDLQLLVNGTYHGLWEEGHVYSQWANTQMTLDARTNDAFITANGTGFQNMGALTTYTNLNTEGLLKNIWFTHYITIRRANEVLKFVEILDDPNFTDELRNQFKGQALFLRGFSYYRLALFFGENIPLITENASIFEELNVAPGTNGEIWTLVEDDLTTAEGLLPESWSADDRGRATKGAAVGILGKAFFQRRMYDKALPLFEKIINGQVGSFGLVENFRDNHTEENEFNEESIFEIHFAPNGSQAGRWLAYSQSAGIARWFNIQATTEILDVFQKENPGDPRYHMTFYAPEGAYRIDGSDTITYDYDLVNNSRTSGIITIRKWDNEVANNSLSRDGINYRVLRYADILLSAAECEVELGNMENAKTYISQVRNRANNIVNEQAQLYFSKDYVGELPEGFPIETNIDTWMAQRGWDIQQVLINERRMEFSFEQSRYFDLIRWDAAGWLNIEDYISEPAFTREKLLFPIPQAELAANKEMLPNSAN